MRRLVQTAVIGFMLLASISAASAYTCNAQGCDWETGYTEPGTLTNGQALTDLTNCTANYTTSIDGAAPGPVKTFSIAASRPQGGQVVTKRNTDATMLPNHTYLVSETVTCTSAAFGTSAPSAPASLLMNNGVSPSPISPAPTLR